jgi:hypothetical protein
VSVKRAAPPTPEQRRGGRGDVSIADRTGPTAHSVPHRTQALIHAKLITASAGGRPEPPTPDADCHHRQPVVICVEPVGRGRFRARLEDGTELGRSTSTPFLAACRKLLALGHDPKQPAVMRQCGAMHDALRSTIGAAALLTVREDGTPRCARLAPNAPAPREGSSSIAPTTCPVHRQPPAGAPTGDGAPRRRCERTTKPVADPTSKASPAPGTPDEALYGAKVVWGRS